MFFELCLNCWSPVFRLEAILLRTQEVLLLPLELWENPWLAQRLLLFPNGRFIPLAMPLFLESLHLRVSFWTISLSCAISSFRLEVQVFLFRETLNSPVRYLLRSSTFLFLFGIPVMHAWYSPFFSLLPHVQLAVTVAGRQSPQSTHLWFSCHGVQQHWGDLSNSQCYIEQQWVPFPCFFLIKKLCWLSESEEVWKTYQHYCLRMLQMKLSIPFFACSSFKQILPGKHYGLTTCIGSPSGHSSMVCYS